MKRSLLEIERIAYKPKLPALFQQADSFNAKLGAAMESAGDHEQVKKHFPNTYGMPIVSFEAGQSKESKPLNLAVILSGGQAPGGHNVISGLFDALKKHHHKSKLYGFLGGPSGLIENKYREISKELLANFRNTGGFDIIGSGRTKLESPEQFDKTRQHLESLHINALVIIGGDDSNTNAGILAEYFLANKVNINVIGVPKTIDGDLKNEYIETSFGFDTATKVYSELVGNIARDAKSAKKYWHFIKLMGRSASHITLECALQTQPNIALIGEEAANFNHSLKAIVNDMADIIAKRADNGENFGVALIPEGLIEFIPEMRKLIDELNELMVIHQIELEKLESLDEKISFIREHITAESKELLDILPVEIARQLALDRDPHGNVQVSRIDTEKLLLEMVKIELKRRKKEGSYAGKFSAQNHFFGYEGRCSMPSNFDADYGYSLGYTAAKLAICGLTGYMSCIRNLSRPAIEWQPGGVPITSMLNMERRHGEDRPVIQKALTKLDGEPFLKFKANREKWSLETSYVYPGPIQYYGPDAVCNRTTISLELENQ
ncbi:MAG TPA: diphosphate--fructose-6-phosphate 1-phosphotransferase [Candidatus Marinimicrobia bacterium]|nr:diphosphate--fructose-6-phosphate 1-phosphotransferase [Candidatus Neomarinimicrobiota bacterium]